jgi:hypothetical protein
MKNRENKQILGFRRVRGRVIPISGHVAGNAGAASLGLAGAAMLTRATGTAKLDAARRLHSKTAGLNKYYKMKFNLIDTAHTLKDMSSSDFLSVRNATLGQSGKNYLNMGRAKSVAKSAIRDLRFSALAKNAAIGLGALSLGALAYQRLNRGKKRR